MLQTHQHHKHDIEFLVSITWISDGDLKMAFTAMSVCDTEISGNAPNFNL